MEDIGDYIYLIIVAVAGIGSFLKNKNKKQQASSIPEQVDEEYEYEEIPEEVYTPVPDPTPVKRPEVVFERSFTEMKKTPHDTIMSFDNTSDVSKLKAKKEVSKTVTSKAKSTQEISTEPESVYSISTVDEARAAFISSEIFNRKY
jgi:hypothetical protein